MRRKSTRIPTRAMIRRVHPMDTRGVDARVGVWLNTCELPLPSALFLTPPFPVNHEDARGWLMGRSEGDEVEMAGMIDLH